MILDHRSYNKDSGVVISKHGDMYQVTIANTKLGTMSTVKHYDAGVAWQEFWHAVKHKYLRVV